MKNEKKSPEVVFVSADDWTALYVDGVKKDEGHSLNHTDVLAALGIKCKRKRVDEEWLSEEAGSSFPDDLSEVKFE